MNGESKGTSSSIAGHNASLEVSWLICRYRSRVSAIGRLDARTIYRADCSWSSSPNSPRRQGAKGRQPINLKMQASAYVIDLCVVSLALNNNRAGIIFRLRLSLQYIRPEDSNLVHPSVSLLLYDRTYRLVGIARSTCILPFYQNPNSCKSSLCYGKSGTGFLRFQINEYLQ